MSSTKEKDDASILIKLEKLARLREQGTLSDEEFQELKSKIFTEEIRETGETAKSEETKTSVVYNIEAPNPVTSSTNTLPAEVQGRQRFWLFLNWALGIFFLLGGVGIMADESEGNTFGIISLFIAGLFLPPIRSWTFSVTGISIPTWARAFLVLGLLIYGGGTIA